MVQVSFCEYGALSSTLPPPTLHECGLQGRRVSGQNTWRTSLYHNDRNIIRALQNHCLSYSENPKLTDKRRFAAIQFLFAELSILLKATSNKIKYLCKIKKPPHWYKTLNSNIFAKTKLLQIHLGVCWWCSILCCWAGHPVVKGSHAESDYRQWQWRCRYSQRSPQIQTWIKMGSNLVTPSVLESRRHKCASTVIVYPVQMPRISYLIVAIRTENNDFFKFTSWSGCSDIRTWENRLLLRRLPQIFFNALRHIYVVGTYLIYS